MSGITLAQAEAKLAAALAAEEKAYTAQASGAAGRNITRAMLSQLADRVTYWDAKVKELSGNLSGRGRSITVAPK